MAYDADLLVIGSGPAGEKGAVQAAYFGRRVILVERDERPGGAAVHTGTLPSKTLRETALFLAGHRQRDLYGVSLTVEPELAVQRMLARKEAVEDAEVERIGWNLERHGVRLVRGTARLTGPHEVCVTSAAGSQIMSAGFILVATGSSPHHPAGIPFEDGAIDDSDSILTIDRLPDRLAVLGAGVIGCEYASMFAELGVAVTLVEPRERLVPFLDHDISDALAAALRAQGIDVRLGTAWAGVVRAGNDIVVDLGEAGSIATDRLLVTSGRSGNTANLGLAELGVELDRRGYVVVDDGYATSVPSILAAGDVVGFPALASTSMEQGRVAVCRAFGFAYKREVSRLQPSGIYTIPEVSGVGLTSQQAAAQGVDTVIGRANYAANARGRITGASHGLLKLVFDRSSRRLLGTHAIGDQASEIVHIGQAVTALGGTVDTLVDMVFNYPSLSECYKYAAYDALGRWAEPGLPASDPVATLKR